MNKRVIYDHTEAILNICQIKYVLAKLVKKKHEKLVKNRILPDKRCC